MRVHRLKTDNTPADLGVQFKATIVTTQNQSPVTLARVVTNKKTQSPDKHAKVGKVNSK